MNKKRRTGLKIALVIALVVAGVIILGMLLLFFLFSDDDLEDNTAEDTEYVAENEEDSEQYYSKDEDGESPVNIKDNSKPVSKNNKTWTVMVYLCGADLESKMEHASDNLIEMIDRDSSDKVNVLVETGGCKEWHMKEYAEYGPEYDVDIDAKTLSYYCLTDGTMKLEKTLPSLSMGDPKNLKEFIKWGAKAHPADSYMLVLWDHGGGSINGVCFDELYDDDSLSLPEIRQAIGEADIPLEVIGLDACLMATLDTAEALQGYGHYMVASEESVPGTGWDYTDFLSFLSTDPTMDGLKLGKRVSDGFMNKCKEYEIDAMATMSVIDLTRIPALSSTYRNLSGELVLSTQNTDTLKNVMQGASKAESFGANSESQGYSNLVDLGDLLTQTGNVLNKNSGNVMKALKDAVCYEVHGSNRGSSCGLSVFYPLDTDDYDIEIYKEISDNTAFLEYLSILSGDWDSDEWEKAWEEAWKEAYSKNEAKEGKYDSYFNGGQSIAADYDETMTEDYYESISSLSPVQKSDYNLKFKQDINKDGYYQLKITSGLDMVSAVDFLLYCEDAESGKYVYLGSDNNLYCDYEKGVFRENFEGSWMTIGGEFVYAELTEENEDYNLYTIPIRLNGEEKYLKAEYDFNKEEYNILGAYDGVDEETGFSGRDIKQLKKGDKVEFLFYVYDPDSENDEDDMIPLSKITWDKNTKMEDGDFEDAGFIYMFMIKSIFGDEDFGDPIYMTIKNGEISAY